MNDAEFEAYKEKIRQDNSKGISHCGAESCLNMTLNEYEEHKERERIKRELSVKDYKNWQIWQENNKCSLRAFRTSKGLRLAKFLNECMISLSWLGVGGKWKSPYMILFKHVPHIQDVQFNHKEFAQLFLEETESKQNNVYYKINRMTLEQAKKFVKELYLLENWTFDKKAKEKILEDIKVYRINIED